jgi:hypothetical protein
MNHSSTLRFRVFGLTILVLTLLVKYYFWPWAGSRLTPDSYSYISAARSLLETGTFGANYIYWPPLYPSALALYVLFVPDFSIAASFLNATILIILLTGYWKILKETLPSEYLVGVGLLLAAFSSPLDITFDYAWSEPLFLLASLFCLYFWSRFFSLRRRSDLIISATLLSACLLTRHIGIIAAVVMLASIFFFSSTIIYKIKIISIGLLASAPYLVWVFRTWWASDTLTGIRTSSNNGLLNNFSSFSRILAHWWFPHSYFTGSIPIAVGLTTLSLLLVLSVAYASIKKVCPEKEVEHAVTHIPVFVVLCAGFILCYSIFLVFSSAIIKVDAINERLVSPIFLPLLYVLLYGCSLLTTQLALYKPKIKGIFVAGTGIWFLFWISAPNQLNGLLLTLLGN